MKKLVLIVLAITVLVGCGAPSQYHDYRDTQYQQQEEPLKFSNDPILDSVYRDRYLESLRRCGSGRDRCRKGD
jgi:hypothetical protein